MPNVGCYYLQNHLHNLKSTHVTIQFFNKIVITFFHKFYSPFASLFTPFFYPYTTNSLPPFVLTKKKKKNN